MIDVKVEERNVLVDEWIAMCREMITVIDPKIKKLRQEISDLIYEEDKLREEYDLLKVAFITGDRGTFTNAITEKDVQSNLEERRKINERWTSLVVARTELLREWEHLYLKALGIEIKLLQSSGEKKKEK